MLGHKSNHTLPIAVLTKFKFDHSNKFVKVIFPLISGDDFTTVAFFLAVTPLATDPAHMMQLSELAAFTSLILLIGFYDQHDAREAI